MRMESSSWRSALLPAGLLAPGACSVDADAPASSRTRITPHLPCPTRPAGACPADGTGHDDRVVATVSIRSTARAQLRAGIGRSLPDGCLHPLDCN